MPQFEGACHSSKALAQYINPVDPHNVTGFPPITPITRSLGVFAAPFAVGSDMVVAMLDPGFSAVCTHEVLCEFQTDVGLATVCGQFWGAGCH